MSAKDKKSSFRLLKSNFIAALLFILYGVFFLYLYFSHKIIFFVHPDYAFLALFTGIFLLILALANTIAIFIKTKIECNDCCSDPKFFNKKRNIFFLLIPFILSLLFPIKPLSSATAQARVTGYNSDAGLSRSVNISNKFFIRSENRALIDWIRLFSQDPEPDHYKSQKAKIIGFVLKDSTLPKDYFSIARFVISCCAADARPIGIPIRYNPEKFRFEENQWIELQGTFDTAEIQNERQPIIILENFKNVAIPENPYAE